jgi:hypothetical protein
MKQQKLLGRLLSIIILLSFAHAPLAHAAPSTNAPLNLTISPALVNLVTKPGQTVTADLRVKNSGTETEHLQLSLLKFGANGDSGQPQLMGRGPSDDYFDWAHFSVDHITAEPNVWMTVKMTITVPPKAAGGYYYAAVFSRLNPSVAEKNQSAVQGGTATLVLLDAEAPAVKHQANIVSFTADRKFYEFLPATFTVKMRNDGDVHLAPVGSIFIKRGSSRVDLLDFNTAHGNILPHTNRAFTIGWQNGFPVYAERHGGNDLVTDKHGQPVRKLTWDFNSPLSKIRFGHYTADLLAVYDNGQEDVPLEATVSFWVIPWRLLGIVLLALLFGGAGIWATSRGLWQKASALRKLRATSKKDASRKEPSTHD